MIRLCLPMGRIAAVYYEDVTYVNCEDCDKTNCDGQCLQKGQVTNNCGKCPKLAHPQAANE